VIFFAILSYSFAGPPLRTFVAKTVVRIFFGAVGDRAEILPRYFGKRGCRFPLPSCPDLIQVSISFREMDCRVKPGNDGKVAKPFPPG
jgi:hypothetical protein